MAGECSIPLCTSCGVTVDSSNGTTVANHCHTVHGRMPNHECKECGFVFWSKSKLTAHIEKFHSSRQHLCKVCNATYPSTKTLNEHIRNLHTPSQLLFCNFCMFPCEGQKDLEEHLSKEHDDEWLTCEVCVRSSEGEDSKSNDKENGTAERGEDDNNDGDESNKVFKEKKQSKDETCPIVVYYRTKEDLLRHMHAKHPSPDRICTVCGEVSETAALNRRHRSNAHPTVYPFRCNNCGMRFNTQDGLLKHRRRNHASEMTTDAHRGQLHGCPSCSRTFGTLRAASRHFVQVHKTHLCRGCGTVFGDRTWKRYHERHCLAKLRLGFDFRLPEYIDNL